jgi:hypothetical protein
MRRDALFDLADALACRPERVHMLAELCLEPECRRGHGGVYDAVNSGELVIGRLRLAVDAVPLRPPVTVAERPARAGRRVRPQPVAHIDRQPDLAIIAGRQRHPRQCPAQSPGLHFPAVQRAVQGAMAALMPWLQRQFRQHLHPVLPAQRRVAQLT